MKNLIQLESLLKGFNRNAKLDLFNLQKDMNKEDDAKLLMIDEPDMFLIPSINNGGMSEIGNSLRYLMLAKSHEEYILERKKKTLFERISSIFNNSEDFETVKDFNDLSDNEIQGLFNNLDSCDYIKIYNDYKDFIESSKLLKSYNLRIKNILSNLLKRLRDLKEIFTKQHSFHFKNLDDYHSLILIDRAS